MREMPEPQLAAQGSLLGATAPDPTLDEFSFSKQVFQTR